MKAQSVTDEHRCQRCQRPTRKTAAPETWEYVCGTLGVVLISLAATLHPEIAFAIGVVVLIMVIMLTIIVIGRIFEAKYGPF